jgi:hypothetical protein
MADTTDSALYGPSGELLGQALGDAIAQGDYSKVQQLLQELKSGYSNLPGAKPVTPGKLGATALGGVTEDPNLSRAENAALEQLMNLATSGGLNDADKAKLEQAKLAGLATARGLQGANEQGLRSRGIYNSGAELAGDLNAQQAGVNTAHMGDVATAGSAADRALAALEQGGAYASNLAGRDLAQKDTVANAQDSINRFNATSDMNAQLYNSPLAMELALAKLKGIGGVDAAQMGQLNMLGGMASRKGAGYGRQIGDLFGAKSGGGNAGNLYANANNPYPSDPSDWNGYPGGSGGGGGGGSDAYGGYKLGEGDASFGADTSSLDDLLNAFNE